MSNRLKSAVSPKATPVTPYISTFEGGNALSAFRAQQLLPALQAIHPKAEDIAARFVAWW